MNEFFRGKKLMRTLRDMVVDEWLDGEISSEELEVAIRVSTQKQVARRSVGNVQEVLKNYG